MGRESVIMVDQIARQHEGNPEELLMKMAVKALRAVDIICEVCQGKIETPSGNGGMEL